MNILIVDDHALFAESLAHVLRAEWSGACVNSVGSCAAAIRHAADGAALDLLLLDLGLPGHDGIDALQVIRAALPLVPVIVVSAHDERDTVMAAIEQGAMGFVPKCYSRAAFLAALEVFRAGGVFLPPGMDETVAGRGTDAASWAARPRYAEDLGLTPREIDVLRLIVEGKPNKFIARSLNIAEGTVKVHAQAICRKLQVTRRTEAIVAVSRMRLVLRARKVQPDASRGAAPHEAESTSPQMILEE